MTMTTKKILVTGSKGVIGSKLVEMLTQKGHDVFGIDLTHGLGEVGWEHPMGTSKFSYARCDVSNFRELQRVFEKAGPFDYVYHCAAEFGRWNGEDYYEKVWTTNAVGTKNIIRLQEKLDFKLIHFSSSEVYGDFNDIMKEDVLDNEVIKQLNDYAMSKWVNEMQIRVSRIKHGTCTLIVRLFNTYGPGEWYHPYRSVNCKFCFHALKGLPVIVYKGHFRTSTYIDDACRTLANIADNFKDAGVYNIGGLEYHDIETLVREIWDYTGADPSLITYSDSEILTTRSKRVDISQAVKDFDHKLTVPLKEGVRRTIDWMRDYYKIKK